MEDNKVKEIFDSSFILSDFDSESDNEDSLQEEIDENESFCNILKKIIGQKK